MRRCEKGKLPIQIEISNILQFDALDRHFIVCEGVKKVKCQNEMTMILTRLDGRCGEHVVAALYGRQAALPPLQDVGVVGKRGGQLRARVQGIGLVSEVGGRISEDAQPAQVPVRNRSSEKNVIEK
ncbi:hypothetical protein AVEN_173975-1 [Araneus ventricosus]|uniref:Uncharacterized protein n=1 Tax=Araneus ventricosus TaxID=182803 RepID=A0A4Y2K3Q4_ARAVE|nr:hypothetical protein AVEN_173975-1 [Araneus ventricosus]